MSDALDTEMELLEALSICAGALSLCCGDEESNQERRSAQSLALSILTKYRYEEREEAALRKFGEKCARGEHPLSKADEAALRRSHGRFLAQLQLAVKNAQHNTNPRTN